MVIVEVKNLLITIAICWGERLGNKRQHVKGKDWLIPYWKKKMMTCCWNLIPVVFFPHGPSSGPLSLGFLIQTGIFDTNRHFSHKQAFFTQIGIFLSFHNACRPNQRICGPKILLIQHNEHRRITTGPGTFSTWLILYFSGKLDKNWWLLFI